MPRKHAQIKEKKLHHFVCKLSKLRFSGDKVITYSSSRVFLALCDVTHRAHAALRGADGGNQEQHQRSSPYAPQRLSQFFLLNGSNLPGYV